MAVEGAVFLVAVGSIECALVFWATEGKPLNFGTLIVRPALGPLPRSSKIYDFRHSIAFVAPGAGLAGQADGPPERWPETLATALVCWRKTSLVYIG